jgi:hypothetical protein
VKRDELGLETVELDLREMAFSDFSPTIDAGLGFLSLRAIERAKEFGGTVARATSR